MIGLMYQLIAEYKECMQAAVQQKQYFLKMLAGVVSLESGGVMRELLESEKDEFEADLRATLEVCVMAQGYDICGCCTHGGKS